MHPNAYPTIRDKLVFVTHADAVLAKLSLLVRSEFFTSPDIAQ